MKRALVCGAGGFIGGHLVKKLKREGYWVRGVDIKEHEFAPTAADEFLLLDLRRTGELQSRAFSRRKVCWYGLARGEAPIMSWPDEGLLKGLANHRLHRNTDLIREICVICG